jgi:hypothetical protein
LSLSVRHLNRIMIPGKDLAQVERRGARVIQLYSVSPGADVDARTLRRQGHLIRTE